VKPHAHGVLLDVGCGSRPFASVYAARVSRDIGVDLGLLPSQRPPDILARAEALPVRSASVDTVLSLSLLTYVTDPASVITEAHRVLKPGGVAIFEFTQMAPVHDAPHDYYRFTRFAARHLLESAGFEVVEVVPAGGLWGRVGLTAIGALNRINRGPTRVLTEVPVRALYIVLQLAFELLDRVFFDEREVLGNIVVAKRRA
jgi:SAM-dependent methyltransferase